MNKYWLCISSIYLFLNILSKCKELENKSLTVLANYKYYNDLGNNSKNRRTKGRHNINNSNWSNNNEYSFLSLKASSIFNQHYVAKLINTVLYKGLHTHGYFHRNPAVYESLSRTNFFFYLTVLNKENVKRIVKLISRAHSAKNKKYDVFKKQLMYNFNCPDFQIDDVIKTEMDHALITYNKAKSDSYWGMIDALKSDGLLLARTFMSVSFAQSLRGIIGLINHELIDLCFSNAYLYNNIASFDKLLMNNIFGVIMSYVFKSFLLFFYPLVMPFRGAFAFAMSSFCITQLSKIMFAVYRNVKRLYRISYRKMFYAILKINILKHPDLQEYAMKLLQGDSLILVSKIWKLSYVNVTDHLSGKNLFPVLNNLFEKNLGTGFFDFSHSLFKYVTDALNDLKLLNTKDGELDKETVLKSETFKKVLLILQITRRTLYYEESYIKLAVSNILTKFFTLISVNINYISKMNPKEFFQNDLDSEFKYIYEDQIYETYLQKISSNIVRKPFIKKNIRRINRGSIEFTLSLIKIKLLHYKPSLNFPYSSLYFDEKLKKQLNSSMKLLIKGATGIISGLVNYGEKFKLLKSCPLELAKKLNQPCNYESFEVKKLLFPLNIFINLLIPLFLEYNDVLVDKKVITNMVNFFSVITDSKELYLYEYLKNTVDTIKRSENAELVDINYDDEINKIIHNEIHKVLDEVNTEKINSLKFHSYTMKDEGLYLHNKEGRLYKFSFNQNNRKEFFLKSLNLYTFRNPLMHQVPYIKFEPLNSNNGNLIVGSHADKYEGKLTQCYMCLKEDNDTLVVDVIHHILWASGFSSMIGAVKQYFHQALSWKRALLSMVPTEFYEVHRLYMEKTSKEKDRSQNYFLKKIRKYRFQFNKVTFSRMFKTFLENVLNKINFFNTEESVIILVMSALYALYKNIEKNEIPVNETYKLYQQKLLEAYNPKTSYAYNYETYTMNKIKSYNEHNKIKKYDELPKGNNNNNDNSNDGSGDISNDNGNDNDNNTNNMGDKKQEDINAELTLEDEIVKSTKYLRYEIESREHEKKKIIDHITTLYGEIPNIEKFQDLPSQCYFLLYYDYSSFMMENIMGIDDVMNNIKKEKIKIKGVKNLNHIQNTGTKFATIGQTDLIKILCGTHLFFKKEHIPLDDMYRFEYGNDVVRHLLIIMSLLRIEKKNNRHSWKRFLALEEYLDQRKKYFKTPLKLLYLKMLNVKRVVGYARKKALMTLGKRIKGKRLINIMRYTRFFEIIENAEVINDFYPHSYIKFEDILVFSNVFQKFKYPLIRYTADQQNVKEMLNNFKLAPNTSVNNEKYILRIFRLINLIIKQKFSMDLFSIKKNDNYFSSQFLEKSEHILNKIHFDQKIEQYLSQLIGFLKLLSDMKFTNFLFLRNLYIFIKFYAATDDLDYSIRFSSIYLCNRNYLNFILNSILEFETFKKFIQKLKDNNDLKKYPIDHLNFQVQCYASDNIKTYRASTTDLEKLARYNEIMDYDVQNFYKDYLLLDLFYDDIDIKGLNTYYQKIDQEDQKNVGKTSSIYIAGSKNVASNVLAHDIAMINETVQNYIYLEKFLQKSNVPIIPFEGFTIAPDVNNIDVYFTNKATTAPFYSKNILDQFYIVGKAFTNEYFQKVKCSFVNYPFFLYYWFILNPGKPNIESMSKTGLVKEDDLKPKSKEAKEEEEQLIDEKIVTDILSANYADEEIDNEDLMSEASTSEGEDSELDEGYIRKSFEKKNKFVSNSNSEQYIASDNDTLSNVSEDSSSSADSTTTDESYKTVNSDVNIASYKSANSDTLTESDKTLPKSQSFLDTSNFIKEGWNENNKNSTYTLMEKQNKNEKDDDILDEKEGDQNTLLYKNYSNCGVSDDMHNENMSKEYEMDKIQNENDVNFLQKTEKPTFSFDSTMITEKYVSANNGKHGFFNRSYNMYIPKTSIYRNFHLVIKVVHSVISLNKFSVFTPVEIIKKGLTILNKKRRYIKQNMNPFINKMILDINDTVQKIKSTSEKGYNLPKSDLFSLYKIVEFQLFNQYLIYPPLKRLKQTELKYILDVINEGYYYYINKLVKQLREDLVVKDNIARTLSSFKEYTSFFFDEGTVNLFYQMFKESITCKNVKCFDFLFNDFISRYYNNTVMSITNDDNTFQSLAKIFKENDTLNSLREDIQNIYISSEKKSNETEHNDLESTASSKPKITYEDLVLSSLQFPKKIEPWNCVFTLFNIKHLYMNVGYLLLGVVSTEDFESSNPGSSPGETFYMNV
ncbi:rhoptry neck protein 3 [Plasmodium brasilianum]|uniref:Rhoptry neck protein 3 n=1 Tax=Plasmodium brasilianum TaxID=5824 RepID=A0ACB9Y3U3_PLABR|nr:rhoptry neck protein 3 [Plasmodium brasilianum]